MLIILITLPLSGCSETSQLHQKLIIQGIGVDQNEEGNYDVTIQAYDYQNSTSEGEIPFKTLELSGSSIMQAFSNIYKQTGLEPLYSQNMLIILGEDLCESGVSKAMDFFIRHYEVRPDAKICVAKGEARDIIECKKDGKNISIKDLSELVYDKNDVIHFVGMIKDGISSPSVTAIAVKGEKEDDDKEIVAEGIAYFKNDVLIGFSNSSQTVGIELINGDCVGKTYVIDVGNGIKAACTVRGISKEVKAETLNEGLKFDVKLKLDAGIYELSGKNTNLGEGISKGELENKLSLYVNDVCKKTIEEVVVKNSIDIFRFGKLLMNTNPNYFRSLEDWSSELSKASYSVNSQSDISVTGTEILF